MENTILSLGGLTMIDVSKASFSEENGGYISFTYDGTEYKKVKLKRALPYKMPEEYISVSDKDGKEIGIIRSLSDFDEKQQQIVKNELQKLYYSPVVTKIISANDRMGYMYFNVITKVGKREFAVRDASKNISYINSDSAHPSVQIRDVDGNRYIIEDYSTFDPASAKKIDAFLM